MRRRPAHRLNSITPSANPQALAWFAEHGRPVSIVIPSYHDVPFLRAALESVERTCRDVDYEVIIVDDSIDAVVGAQLRAFESDRVSVVFKSERLGFAGTVNVGMRRAKHDVILLNSDIVALDGWVQALQHSAYAKDPAIGMVSPKLLYPDGRIQYGGTYYARLLAPQWFGHLHVGSDRDKPTANVPGYNVSVSGACVYITRHALARVGLLDEEYWLGFEDVDYGLQAWNAGVRCYYEPSATLIHHESATRGYSQGWRELASMRKFWRRWGDRFLRRRVSPSKPVVFTLAQGSEPLWRAYIERLATVLRGVGRTVSVLTVDGHAPDEATIALAREAGVIIACDWRSATSAWLASALGGSALAYVLPSMESIGYPTDPARQAAIVAGYRSDFDFVAPNGWTSAQLSAEAAWRARAVIAPALRPQPLPGDSSSVVYVIGAGDDIVSRIREVAAERGHEVVTARQVVSEGDLSAVAAARPRVIVDFAEHQSSLAPFSLMSLGGVYLAPSDPRLTHEVLDGYNALLFDRADIDRLSRSLEDALENAAVWNELRENAYASALFAAEAAEAAFLRVIEDVAQRPV